MDREALCAAVHGVTKSQTRLSNWTDRTDESINLIQDLITSQSSCLFVITLVIRISESEIFVAIVQSLSHVQLFATPWTAACQASLSFTISQSLPKLISIESVMPPNNLILCHPLFPPDFNLSQYQVLLQWVSTLATAGGQSIGASGLASVPPMNIQGWFLLGLTGLISLLSKGLSRVFSSTTCQKPQFFCAQPFFMVQLSHLYMTTRKAISLTAWTFVSKVMSLLFNMLSRLVMNFGRTQTFRPEQLEFPRSIQCQLHILNRSP